MIYGGKVTVTTAGTAKPLSTSSIPCAWVKVEANPNNSGMGYIVGLSETTKNANDNTNGIDVIGGGIVEFPPCGSVNFYNLNKIYVDVATNGDGFKFLYGRV